jgi:hypothetical protein
VARDPGGRPRTLERAILRHATIALRGGQASHPDPLPASTMPLTMPIAGRSSIIEASSVRKPAWADVVQGGKQVIGSQRFGVEHVDGPPARLWSHLVTLQTIEGQSDIGR